MQLLIGVNGDALGGMQAQPERNCFDCFADAGEQLWTSLLVGDQARSSRFNAANVLAVELQFCAFLVVNHASSAVPVKVH